MKKLIILCLSILLLTCLLFSVTYQEYNPNDERFKILALKKSRILMEKSEKDLIHAKQLFEKGFISEEELEDYTLQFESDKLNYQQYMLSVIFDKPHISIISALKYQNSENDIIVELTIKNSSGGTYAIEEKALEGLESSNLKPEEIYNIYVSLQDEAGNMISQPYEYHLDKLKQNEEKIILFKLLKDVETVTVSSNYGDKFDKKSIYLKRKSDENLISITSDIYAQEVESGSNAIYSIDVEYFGDLVSKYKIEIEGLPKFYNYNFVNVKNNAIISNLYCNPKNPIQNLKLKINIPEKNKDNLVLDKTIPFSINLLKPNKDIIEQVELELTPTGKASMDLLLNNYYFSAFKGENIEIKPIKLINDGMKDISNISFDIFLPNNWDYELLPEKLDLLSENAEKSISLSINPDDKVLAGIYQIKIKATAKNLNRIIRTAEKEIKIEIKNKSNPMMIILVIIISLSLIISVIYFLIKITKN